MKNGLLIDEQGTRRWYQNGELHRTDGPAIEWPNGNHWWYQNGKKHRTDGPAIEYSNGDHWWFLEAVEHSFEEYVNKIYPDDCPKKTLFILKWTGK